MAKDSYYPQKFKCEKCNRIEKVYVWLSKVDETTPPCSHCKAPMEPTDESENQSIAPVVIGLKREQHMMERRNRNKRHFKDKVLPSILDPDAKRHHITKLQKK